MPTPIDREAMRDTLNYIKREWPEIPDPVPCARFALRNEVKYSIEVACGYWFRHCGAYFHA